MSAPKARGLGRGLSALLGEDATLHEQQRVALNQLRPGRFQPRIRFDDAALQELVHSVRHQGVLQPLLVRSVENGQLEIIAGERRYRAAQLAGLSDVPVMKLNADDQQALAIALIENMQREDLTAIEEAQGIQRLIEEFHFTHERAAEAVGRSRAATTNLLRLLSLPRTIQQMLENGELEMGHARALLAAPANQQLALAQRVRDERLTVRQIEALAGMAGIAHEADDSNHPTKAAKAKTGHRPNSKSHARKASPPQDLVRLERQLSEQLAAQVRIHANARGKGVFAVQFASLDELDGLLQRFNLKTE